MVCAAGAVVWVIVVSYEARVLTQQETDASLYTGDETANVSLKGWPETWAATGA